MALPFNPGPSISQFNVPQSPFGNLSQLGLLQVPVSPGGVSAATTVEQFFPVVGLQATDIVFVSKPSAQAGLAIAASRAAAGTLCVTYVNTTAAPIFPSAESYAVLVARPQPFVALNLPLAMPLL